ncbi:MAG: hypothetical protein MJZ37_10555 [Bacilli bacterium]|nr:hypothetical protein [Bacilli bacterium]
MSEVIVHQPTKSEFKRMAMQLGYEPIRHGHWDEGHEMMTCTNCCEQFDLYFKNDFNYCPNCGAKMDEKEI